MTEAEWPQGSYHIQSLRDLPDVHVIVETERGEALWASLFRDVGLCKSSSEARNLIKQGGLYIDDHRLQTPDCLLLWGRKRFVTVDEGATAKDCRYYDEITNDWILMRRGKKKVRRAFFWRMTKGAE